MVQTIFVLRIFPPSVSFKYAFVFSLARFYIHNLLIQTGPVWQCAVSCGRSARRKSIRRRLPAPRAFQAGLAALEALEVLVV